jgi:hypothetical protein
MFVVTVLMLVSGAVLGQQVDPSVQPVDPSVNPRVQDVDRPDSALLPGGSSSWTGQPIMSQTPSGATEKDFAVNSGLFPSLTSMSTWGTTPLAAPSSSNSDGAVPTPVAGSASSNTKKLRLRNESLAAKLGRYRKLNAPAADSDAQSSRSATIDDALLEQALKQLMGTGGAAALQKLRQETARSSRSTRTRIYNPLRAKADAASASRWQSDQSSDYALKQQQHETGVLLQNGFYDRTERRRRHHRRGALRTSGSHD